jgi:tellurite resistance protein TerC
MINHLAQRIGQDDDILLVFILIIGIFLIADLITLQRYAKVTSLKSAAIQTLCWVGVSLIFCAVLFKYKGHEPATQYLSAYLMEYALSADNIFVFILILNYFKLSEKYYHKVLFYGIGLAIILRLIFIFIGITLVNNFHWILYLFGVILVYTGIKMFFSKGKNSFEPEKNYAYRFLHNYLNFTNDEGNGKLRVRREGINYFTVLFLVIGIIAFTDLIFAVDSIPAVFAISQNKLVIITSNIFAVLGLRSMFFLLHNMVKKFTHLHEGISTILIFIGLKMLLRIINVNISTQLSLLVIVAVLLTSIIYSLLQKNGGDNSAR